MMGKNLDLNYDDDDGEKGSKIRRQAKRARTYNLAFVFIIVLFVYVCIDTELHEDEEEEKKNHNIIKKNVRGLTKKMKHLKKNINIPAMKSYNIDNFVNRIEEEEEGKVNNNFEVDGLSNLLSSKTVDINNGNVGSGEHIHTPILLPPKSLYRVSDVLDRYDNVVQMSKYAGMITLIVNVACKWGKTDSTYRELIQLQNKYSSQGFTVLAFPTNQFHQELGSNDEIKTFLDTNYPNINFPIMGLSESLSTNKVYQNLQQQMPSNNVRWNFFKYLVDRKGQAIAFYDLNESPISPVSRIIYDIDNLLKKQPYESIVAPKYT